MKLTKAERHVLQRDYPIVIDMAKAAVGGYDPQTFAARKKMVNRTNRLIKKVLTPFLKA